MRSIFITILALALVAPGALATPLVSAPGVAEVGTIDPSSTHESGEGSYDNGEDPTSEQSTTSSCIIPWFGGCLLWFEQTIGSETAREDSGMYSYRDDTYDDRSGYYVDLGDGTVLLRVTNGTYSTDGESASSGHFRHYDRNWDSHNFGWSQEQSNERRADGSKEGSYESRRDGQNADLVVAGQPVGGSVSGDRQTDGHQRSDSSSEQTASNRSDYTNVGTPITSFRDSESTSSASTRESHWNSTDLASVVYLINPIDQTRVEIVGLRLAEGDRSTQEASSGQDESTNEYHPYGIPADIQRTSDEHSASSDRYEEWLRLELDLVDGLVQGRVASEGGTDSTSETSDHQYTRDINGYPYAEDRTSNDQQTESAWRTFELDLSAPSAGTGVTFSAWDTEDTVDTQEDDNGATRNTTTHEHRRGLVLGITVADGLLTIGYQQETREDETSETTAAGTQESHTTSESRDVNVGSNTLPVDEGAGTSEVSSHWTWTPTGGEPQETTAGGRNLWVTSGGERTYYAIPELP